MAADVVVSGGPAGGAVVVDSPTNPFAVIDVIVGGAALIEVGSPASVSHAGTIGIVIDGGGVPIVSGLRGFFEVPTSCVITAATVLSTDPAVTPGSIVVDLWKAPYAAYPPTAANSITASTPPTLVGAIKSRNTTLAGWTKTLAPGDILAFNVVSASAVKRVAVQLTVLLT